MNKRIAIGVLSAVVLFGAAVAGTAAWRHFRHRPSELHTSAVADATKKVGQVLKRFDYDHLYQSSDYAHSAAQHSDVEVLAVTGQTHWQTGVTLIVKVAGHGVQHGADGSVIAQRDEDICFKLQLGPKSDTVEADIKCQPGDPLPIAKDPSLDGVDDQLSAALQGVEPNEAAVRRAIASLKLDPAIRQDVAVHDGTVGVALRAAQYDCLLARVTTAGAALWRPSHTQLAPGELSCSAQTALSGEFGTNPH